MPAISKSAPGKIILFGEHAVVYGQPAIAVPVTQVSAKAILTPNPNNGIHIQAPEISLNRPLNELPLDDALATAVRLTFMELGVHNPPGFILRISSTIPLAAGLGSGAAVSVAIIRGISTFLGHPLPDASVNSLAFEVEKIHHGTPSGIDNTVVTYERPVFFIKDQTIETFDVKTPFTIVIGDSGVGSPTSKAVSIVRQAWLDEPGTYERLFAACGDIARQARQLIETGDIQQLGALMDNNHTLLVKMGVSSVELEHLIKVARQNGALGAKLSGGGLGGNMIALVPPKQVQNVVTALKKAGAVGTITTRIGDDHDGGR